MSWQVLSTQQLVRPHVSSKREIDELRGVVARDLADASLAGLSADRRFATAYNAALQTAKMAVACAGYRVTGLGHHHTSFEAAEIALGSQSGHFSAYFDACRRKRNTVDYDRAYVTTETEADQVLQEAKKYLALTEAWISQFYPQFN